MFKPLINIIFRDLQTNKTSDEREEKRNDLTCPHVL